MRRTTLMVLAACILTLMLGSGANAQGQSYPPGSQVSPAVEAAGGSQDGTAFTGGETRFPTMAAGTLLVLGSLTLYVARRRAKMFLGE